MAYGPGAKARWLGLPPEGFGPHGVVSAAGALALAEAVRESLGASWGLAEVGIAGPQTGRRSRKGAGVAYFAVAGRHSVTHSLSTGWNDRLANQKAFAGTALAWLADALVDGPD